MSDQPTDQLADAPPDGDRLTPYDRAHVTVYLQLLDADTLQIDWKETARRVLALDPNSNFAGAKQCYDAHLARARWMAQHGYRLLLDP
ncbi:MAG: DUF2285 domain-containing protein [Hyphomonadaceae bacterium]|nr:DUF2285 domain-containing protein [Hyphomonadaceae bacterium]